MHVGLPPLSSDDMATMTGAVLGAETVPETLRELIASKAEGNPFFVEELVRSLLEDGTLRREGDGIALARRIEDVAVPDTIQDVLIARIDRLAEDSRRAIQVASVIGREFALRLLARISESGDRIRTQVEDLRSLELIYEKALHPELAYMFKHALTHDVAYESVVAERRRQLHGTIGRAIEELYADRLAEHVETLAHHFGRAEDWASALAYLELSADKAGEAHANRAVVDHCRAALLIAARADSTADDALRARFEARLGLASCYLNDFVASAAAYEDAAGHTADEETRAMHLAAAGYNYFWGHRYGDAQRCNDAALALAHQHGLPAPEAFATTLHGFYRGVERGELDEYAAESRTALEICARHPHPLVEAYASFHLMEVSEWTGDYPAAVAYAEHSLVLGRSLRRPEVLIFSNWFLGKARCCVGDLGGALALLGNAYDLCDRIGDRAWKSRMLNTLGWCYAEMRSVERAREYNEAGAVLAREIGDPEILSNADINLALNHLALGAWSQADDVVGAPRISPGASGRSVDALALRSARPRRARPSRAGARGAGRRAGRARARAGRCAPSPRREDRGARVGTTRRRAARTRTCRRGRSQPARRPRRRRAHRLRPRDRRCRLRARHPVAPRRPRRRGHHARRRGRGPPPPPRRDAHRSRSPPPPRRIDAAVVMGGGRTPRHTTAPPGDAPRRRRAQVPRLRRNRLPRVVLDPV